MERNDANFNDDLKMNPGQLDMEAVRQAELMFNWAEKAIEAKAAVDRQKLALDTLTAKLEMDCRQAPESFNLVKVTEAGVHAAVLVSERYQQANSVLIELKRKAGMLDAGVSALEQKKRMIEVLVTLHGQQYFAGPSVPRDLIGAWQDAQARTEQTIQSKQAKMTRKRGEKRGDSANDSG